MGFSNLLMIISIGFVYGTVFKVPNFNAYFVYLGIGLTGWGMISGSLSSAPQLFELNSKNLQNTNTHPIFYTLEEWAFQVQTFFQSFLIVALVLSLLQPLLVVHLFSAGLLPMLNLIVFSYWLPVLVCLLGARFHDVYQLVPIFLQLIFLLSPILYKREALGALDWISAINPLYVVLDQFRTALISGHSSWHVSGVIFLLNIAGFLLAVYLLDRNRKHLPFLF